MINIKRNNVCCKLSASCKLPTAFSSGTEVEMMCFDYGEKESEVIALVHRDRFFENTVPIVRIHSACITGEIFGSEKCDCGFQFEHGMEKICSSPYGIMLYMTSHEGRGIGIKNKILAYQLQEKGASTIEANTRLGLPNDARNYEPAVAVLKYFKVDSLKLITNNPEKRLALELANIRVLEQISSVSEINNHNKNYLLVKQNVLKHNFGVMLK